jgi:UDP-3-O-acyl N-acetylglucosamine deacetylase
VDVIKASYRYQRTLGRAAEVQGIGYLTGANVRLRFLPAPPHSGVVFVRTDLGPDARVEAAVEEVTGTNRRTTLGRPPVCVSLVEHVLAALAGLRIDNCQVELNASEPPGLDGSALGFVEALRPAGLRLQPARRAVWAVERSVVLHQNGATLALHPADGPGLKVSYVLDYGPFSPLGRQTHTQIITPESFAAEIAACRTFVLEEEAAELKRQGLGARTRVSDLLVFGKSGPIGNRLRHQNEPARHKILDLIGDLSLLGQDLYGHVVAYRSGHPLNVELVRILCRELPAACEELRRAA